MTPQRRRTRDAWRPPRPRHEVVKATLAGLAVVGLTSGTIWLLQPASQPSPTVKPISPSSTTVTRRSTPTPASTPTIAPPTTPSTTGAPAR